MKLCPACSEPYFDDAGFCPLDGAGLVRSTDPLVGRTLAARYRLVRQVGSGGMAVVYLARHVMIERLSAIKILRQDLAMNPSHRERFLREARAVNRINHPNIVEITDYGEDGGLVFLVMEYIEGESLLAALERERFGWVRAARIALQIAAALGRAHELGVIHRDLKPDNVLLLVRDGSEFVKLTDFGIAKIVDAPALTFSEQLFGTPGYIAPEYIEGAATSPLGDLYALGIVLYEMLTGTLPFTARFPVELLALPLIEAPVKPSARVDGIPAELEELVLRLIARTPSDRPRDAFAVHDTLADIVRRLSSLPSRPPHPLQDTERASQSTMVDGPGASALVRSPLRPTAELAALPATEIAARWHASLSQLAKQIEAARRSRGDGEAGVQRARDLAVSARAQVASMERARGMAAEHQARVDRLEAQARAFRGTLGHAIDSLGRDRSRERAHLEAIARRRQAIAGESAAHGGDPKSRNTLAWEVAALEAEQARAREVEADLGFQIETLEKRLDAHNEQLESDLADATGNLEGALSALRRMAGEFLRSIEEAGRAVQ
jgi:eukaryotic-like serine/threonine-protein kinase